MGLVRRQRRWLSVCMMVVLLFTQLATAAYACPHDAAGQGLVAMADMPGCDGHMAGTMDPDQPQLCKAHCEQGTQTVDTQDAADLPLSPLCVATLDWGLAAHIHLPTTLGVEPAFSHAPPRGAPPRYLTLLVLRN